MIRGFWESRKNKHVVMRGIPGVPRECRKFLHLCRKSGSDAARAKSSIPRNLMNCCEIYTEIYQSNNAGVIFATAVDMLSTQDSPTIMSKIFGSIVAASMLLSGVSWADGVDGVTNAGGSMLESKRGAGGVVHVVASGANGILSGSDFGSSSHRSTGASGGASGAKSVAEGAASSGEEHENGGTLLLAGVVLVIAVATKRISS